MWRKKNATQRRHERITMFYSLLTLFAFLRHINALDAPVDLQAVEVSTHSFSVLWRTTDTKAKFFEANILPLNDGETAEANKFLNETFTTWIDLIPGKDYDVSVYSVSEEGIMSEGTKITVTTHPMPVYALRLSRFANPILTEYRDQGGKTMMYPIYGAVVSWQGPDSGRFDNFEVDISPPDGKVRLPLAMQGGRRVEQPLQKRRIAWDLTPGVYYDFGARTMSGNAVSETATAGLRMTPEIPSEIQVDKISPTEATLSWDQPHRGILDNFVVEMTPFESSRVIEPRNSTDKRRTIADLTPGSIYDVDVFSTSFGVLSMKPRKKRIITPPATPLRPVLSRDVTTNSLLVSWQRPPGRLNFYELVYWPTKRDVSRLRHRTWTEQVRLTGLQPSTQYSLLIFSVSNEIHSEPLKAFVWTGNLTTTTPPPVLTTVLSKITQHTESSTTLQTESVSVIIKGSTAKDEADKTKDRERALRNNTEATNGDATSKPSTIIDGITQEMSTIPLTTTTLGRPKTLPPHHSIPYTEPTIEPFPTTVYFSGRVTTSPNSAKSMSPTSHESLTSSPKLEEVEITTTTATTTATSTLHKVDNLVDTETSPTGSPSQPQTDLTSSSMPVVTSSGLYHSVTTEHSMSSSTLNIDREKTTGSMTKSTIVSVTEASPTTHTFSKLPTSGPQVSSKATSIASHDTPIPPTVSSHITDSATVTPHLIASTTTETDIAITMPKTDPSVTSTYASGKTDSSTEATDTIKLANITEAFQLSTATTKPSGVTVEKTSIVAQTDQDEISKPDITTTKLISNMAKTTQTTITKADTLAVTGSSLPNTASVSTTSTVLHEPTNIVSTAPPSTVVSDAVVATLITTTKGLNPQTLVDSFSTLTTPSKEMSESTLPDDETTNSPNTVNVSATNKQTTEIETTGKTGTQTIMETTVPEDIEVTTDNKMFQFTPNGQVPSTTETETQNKTTLIYTSTNDQTTNIKATEETNTQSVLETTISEAVKVTTDRKMFGFTPNGHVTSTSEHETKNTDNLISTTMANDRTTNIIPTEETGTQGMLETTLHGDIKATTDQQKFVFTPIHQETTSTGLKTTSLEVSSADTLSIVKTTSQSVTSKTETKQQATDAKLISLVQRSTAKATPPSHITPTMTQSGKENENSTFPTTHANQDTTNLGDSSTIVASSFSVGATTDNPFSKTVTINSLPSSKSELFPSSTLASFTESKTKSVLSSTPSSPKYSSTESLLNPTKESSSTSTYMSLIPDAGGEEEPGPDPSTTSETTITSKYVDSSFVPSITQANQKSSTPDDSPQPRGSNTTGDASAMTTSYAEDNTSALEQTTAISVSTDVKVTTDQKIIKFFPNGQTTATTGTDSTSADIATTSFPGQNLEPTTQRPSSTQSLPSQSQASTTDSVGVTNKTPSVGLLTTTLSEITTDSSSPDQETTGQSLGTTQPDNIIVTTDHKIFEFSPTGQTTFTTGTDSTSTVAAATSFPVQQSKSTTQSLPATNPAVATSPSMSSVENVTTALPNITIDSTSLDQASTEQSLDTTQADNIIVTTDHKIIKFVPTGETTLTTDPEDTVTATSKAEELVTYTVQKESTTNLLPDEEVSTTPRSPSSSSFASVSSALPLDETTTQQNTSINSAKPTISTESELTSSVVPFPDESTTPESYTDFSQTASKVTSTADSTKTHVVSNTTDDTLTTTPVANSSTTKPKPRDQPDPKSPGDISERETTASNGTPTSLQTTTPNPGNGSTTNGGTTISVSNATAKNVPITKGFQTICKPNNITILVDKKVIGQYEELYGPLHLIDYDDPKCKGVEHENYYRYTIAPDISQCGTEFEINETHVNFTNVVSNSQRRAEWLKQITDSNGQVILGSRLAKVPMVFVHMNIWCTFPRTINVSTPFLPDIQIHMLTFNVSGHGEFSALMQLYRSEAFERPYLRPPMLSMDDTLHVGVSLLETKDPLTFLVVRRCWATPERDPAHPRRYDIIKDSCPVQDSLDGTVEILENGLSKRARWQGSVFKFVRFDQAWIHCEIKVCFGAGCEENCTEGTSRVKRDERSKNANVVTFGPVSLNHTVVTAKPMENNTTAPSGSFLDDTKVLILVVALSVVIVFCCVVIMCVLARLRRQKKRNKQQNVAGSETTSSSPFPTSPVQPRASSDRLEESFKHVRTNSTMSTFGSISSAKSTSPLSMSPGAMAISGGRFGYDNTNFFSSTTELRDAEAAEDFPAPPPEVLSGSHCALNIPPAADSVAIEGIDGQYRKFS